MTSLNVVKAYAGNQKPVQADGAGKSQSDDFGQLMEQTRKLEESQKDTGPAEKPEIEKDTSQTAPDKKEPELKPGEVIPLIDLGWIPKEQPNAAGDTAKADGNLPFVADPQVDAMMAELLPKAQGKDPALQNQEIAVPVKTAKGETEAGATVRMDAENLRTGQEGNTSPKDTAVPADGKPVPAEDKSGVEQPVSPIDRQEGKSGVTAGNNQETAAKADDDIPVRILAADQDHGQENKAGKTEEAQILQTAEQTEVRTDNTVKVKVAEPYHKLEQGTVKDMADQISNQIQSGKKELQIQLDPEHLGKISIKISVEQDGIKVLMSCDNQKTLNLLSDKATGIGRIVEQNLNGPVSVEVKEDGYWNQQKDATDQQSRQNRGQEEKQSRKEETDDFVQQLRLGLFSDKIAVS